MPCYNGRYTTPSNIYGVLNHYADIADPAIKKDLLKLFDKYFGKGELSIQRWPRIQNGIEIIHAVKNPTWTRMYEANVVVAIYPDGRLGIFQDDEVKMEKVEKIMKEFSTIAKHNNNLKNKILDDTEKSLNKMGIKQKNTLKQVKKEPGSFARTYVIPNAIKAQVFQELKNKR